MSELDIFSDSRVNVTGRPILILLTPTFLPQLAHLSEIPSALNVYDKGAALIDELLSFVCLLFFVVPGRTRQDRPIISLLGRHRQFKGEKSHSTS